MNQNSPKMGLLSSIIFLILGALVIYMGYNVSIKNKDKYINYKEIEARVIRHDYDTLDKEMIAIVVEYKVGDMIYNITSNSQSTTPKPIGSTLTIKYNPEKPSEAIFMSDEFVDLIMYVVGGIFILSGGIILAKSIKKSKEESL